METLTGVLAACEAKCTQGSINREVAIRMREGIVILSQLALVHGIALTHVNILAHGLVDLHNVLIDPPL